MRPDLFKSILLITAFAALGATFGYAAEFGIVGAVLANFWILRRANKLHRWLSTKNELPYAEEGVFYHLHRDIRDIFERNHREKRKLNKSLKKFREASSALPDAIVVFDSQGVISWANTLAEKLLGITEQQDVGQRVTNILRSPKFVEALEDHDNNAMNIDIQAPLDPSHMLNCKIVDLSKNTRMLVVRDITRLTDINKAQKDFVSNVSHELKTPLTVMRGYLEMIEDNKEIPQKLIKPVSDMHAQTCRMQRIIEELLYLAKLQSQPNINSLETHEPIAIEGVIDMIMDSAAPLANQNNQSITLDIDKDLSIKGNTSELQIAFNNLVINALRYTPEKGNIAIKWSKVNHAAVFSVKDDGIGIAPNHISRLTERFYRVDQGRSREKGGTGLGLAIVKNILDHHDGKLEIESNLGSGSCFSCVFPLNH